MPFMPWSPGENLIGLGNVLHVYTSRIVMGPILLSPLERLLRLLPRDGDYTVVSLLAWILQQIVWCEIGDIPAVSKVAASTIPVGNATYAPSCYA